VGALSRYLRDYRTWAFLLVVAGLTASCVALRHALTETATQRSRHMVTLVTKWKVADSSYEEVRTEPLAGETPEDHDDRHDIRVANRKAKFPPVGE